MLKSILEALIANKRQIRRSFRINISRPLKDKTHEYNVEFIKDIRFIWIILTKRANLRFLGLLLIGFWIFRDFAFAVEPGVAAANESQNLSSMVDIVNFLISVLTFLVTPLIMLAGWLLSPDWTFGDAFNLRPVLHQLWIYVSNVVYVVFALVLVYIAIVNIFYENKKTYELKSALPRLVISILIVPFSWFVVSGTLSVANYMTAVVIRLPIETISSISTQSFIKNKVIPKKISYNRNKGDTGSEAKASLGDAVFTASDCVKTPEECASIEDIINSPKGGAYNMLAIYAYGVFNLQEYQKIGESDMKGIKTMLQLAEKGGFGLFFFLAFGFMLVSIIAVLFTRIFKLWIVAIFSPVFAISHFFKDAKFAQQLNKNALSIKSFVSLAFVPVYVSAALAFGLMFVSATMSPQPTGDPLCIDSESVSICGDSDADKTQYFIFGVGTKGEIEYSTKGTMLTSAGAGSNGPLSVGKGLLASIIVNFLALGVLWMAVKAALNADEITKSAFTPFEKLGDQFIKEAPKYTPLPIPGGSLFGAQQVMNTASQIPQNKALHRAQNSKLMQTLNKYNGGNDTNAEELRIKELTTEPLTDKNKFKEAQKNILSMAEKRSLEDSTYKSNVEKVIEALPNGAYKTSLKDLKNDEQRAIGLMYGNGNMDEKFIYEASKLYDGVNSGAEMITKGRLKNSGMFSGEAKTAEKAAAAVAPEKVTREVVEKDGKATTINLNAGDKHVKVDMTTPIEPAKITELTDLYRGRHTKEDLKAVLEKDLKGTQDTANVVDKIFKALEVEETNNVKDGGFFKVVADAAKKTIETATKPTPPAPKP